MADAQQLAEEETKVRAWAASRNISTDTCNVVVAMGFSSLETNRGSPPAPVENAAPSTSAGEVDESGREDSFVRQLPEQLSVE